MSIEAKIIADSISPQGIRLTTLFRHNWLNTFLPRYCLDFHPKSEQGIGMKFRRQTPDAGGFPLILPST